MRRFDKPRERNSKKHLDDKRLDSEIWIRDPKTGLWSKQRQLYIDRRRAFEAALAALAVDRTNADRGWR